jgi:lysophospholipase L1-like esterase
VRKATRFLFFPLVLLFAFIAAQPISASSPPASMAALGDSITRATNVCCPVGSYQGQSWSTGDSRDDGIASHYERLTVLSPAIAGRNYNDAVAGGRAASLPGQAAAAVSREVDYVTILIGANDLCTSSAATMTSEAEFAASVNRALATLRQGLPGVRIFVSSIPDIHQLWTALNGNPLARQKWSAGTCQSMLSSSNTDEQRQQVAQRELAFNKILAEACGRYSNCRWDNNAVYNFKFSADDVSTLDYFHPSVSGQARLAELTWRASWWGDQR